MNGASEICVCGHDISTHFEDHERPGEHPPGTKAKKFRGACLGLGCDVDLKGKASTACKRYRPKHPNQGSGGR